MSKYVIFYYILIIHNKVSDINIEVSLVQRIYQCMNQKDMHIYKKRYYFRSERIRFIEKKGIMKNYVLKQLQNIFPMSPSSRIQFLQFLSYVPVFLVIVTL